MITDMTEFAETLGSELEPYLDIPFAFFGYSLGALMAFECARVIRRRSGREPTRLVVAAHKAPQMPRRQPTVSTEPKPEFVRELERRYGPIEPVIKSDPELFDLIIEIMRADLAMLEGYRYQDEAAFKCPILAIAGSQDASMIPAELEGWRTQTAGAFQTHWFAGGHFFLRNCGQKLRALVRDEIVPSDRDGSLREAVR